MPSPTRDRVSPKSAVRARAKGRPPASSIQTWKHLEATIQELLELGYLVLDDEREERFSITPDGAEALAANRPCYETGGGN